MGGACHRWGGAASEGGAWAPTPPPLTAAQPLPHGTPAHAGQAWPLPLMLSRARRRGSSPTGVSTARLQAAWPPTPARIPAEPGVSRRALTAGPACVVPPVHADALLGTQGRVGLQAGALQVRARHIAAVEQAGFIVVLGGRQGVALGKQAVEEGCRSQAGRCPQPLTSPCPGTSIWATPPRGPSSACTTRQMPVG